MMLDGDDDVPEKVVNMVCGPDGLNDISDHFYEKKYHKLHH